MAPNPALPRYVLTGSSGWIGRTLLSHLEKVMGPATEAQVTAFASTERQQSLASGARIAVRALETIGPADVEGAHVIHLAYLTKEKAEQLGERQFTCTNIAIDDAVLAAITGAKSASIFVASSGAAALAASGHNLHPYGLAKLRQEARILEAGSRLGIPTIAGRIFNLAGPNINKLESYAISNFAQQARQAGRIRIEAKSPVFRSYLHVEDLCALIIAAAHRKVNKAKPVDLCGSETIEMEDLAKAVAQTSDNAVSIERGSIDWLQPNIYLGDFTNTKILAMHLGIELTALQKQVLDTVAYVNMQPLYDKNRLASSG